MGRLKTKKNKYVKITDKVCTKQPVIITADRFMELINQIRKVTNKFNLDNKEMSRKYNKNVNARVVKYLRAADIPKHNELKSIHGMRRLFVSFSYSLREAHNMTFELWIQRMLAHDSSSSTMNYNTIKITTAKSRLTVFDDNAMPLKN